MVRPPRRAFQSASCLDTEREWSGRSTMGSGSEALCCPHEDPVTCQCGFCPWCRWFLGLVGTHQCSCNLFRLRDARNPDARWLEHSWCGTLLCRAKTDLEIECAGGGLRFRFSSHSSPDLAAEKITLRRQGDRRFWQGGQPSGLPPYKWAV